MKKAFVFGLNGRMGGALIDSAEECGYTVVGGFDLEQKTDIPTFSDVRDINVDYDVILDFSVPALLTPIVTLCERDGKPLVIATTGYNASEMKTVRLLSEKIPVMYSGNYSLGVAALKAAAETARAILGDAYDIEIVEKHHNRKVDSPSGTAIMLADALAPREMQIIGRSGKRGKGELGITSVRGGGTVGEHEIGFYGEDEIVTLTHSARSRRLFAAGAYKAADFLLSASPALYSMDDLVSALLRKE